MVLQWLRYPLSSTKLVESRPAFFHSQRQSAMLCSESCRDKWSQNVSPLRLFERAHQLYPISSSVRTIYSIGIIYKFLSQKFTNFFTFSQQQFSVSLLFRIDIGWSDSEFAYSERQEAENKRDLLFWQRTTKIQQKGPPKTGYLGWVNPHENMRKS